MTHPPAEDTTADETHDEQRKREHDEAEVNRKLEAAAYEKRRFEDNADAEVRRQAARRQRNSG